MMLCSTRWMRTAAAAAIAVSAGCGGDDGGGSDIPAACNPLGAGVACMMPWPSAAYLREDPTTATGLRVDLPPDAMPVNIDDIAIDPAPWNRFDGFGVAAPMLAAFDTGVSADGLPTHRAPEASLAPDSPIVVLNMDTGERALVFAEPDMNAEHPEERALIIRPLERLAPGARYAVAIRQSVKAADGSPLPIPPAFAALVAGESFDHPLMAKLAPRYDAIFAALEADGVPRDDLVLAWDFVTASDDSITFDNLTMRDAALPLIGDQGQNLSFDATELPVSAPERVYRLLTGTYEVPMFLTDGERDASVLARDDTGAPELVGMGEANFSAVIPQCVQTAELPVPVIVFGHGLFGNAQDYIDDRFLQQVAQDNCVVIVGGDFIGLTDRQVAAVAYAMNDLNKGAGISEKLQQSIINFIALARIVRGPFRTSDEFKVDGAEIIDPERVYYYGASLGGIMGGVYMSYEPDIELGVLGVAGGPWSLLYERSLAWPPLRVAMKGAYDRNPFDYQQNIALMGWAFEKIDPIATAHRVIADPLPGSSPKQLLVYATIGDTLVNNAASWTLARSLKLPVCGPSLMVPYGLVEEQAPAENGLTIYDEGVEPLPPDTNVAPDEDNGTHSDVNERAAVQRQVTHFFDFREVVNECKLDGAPAPCVCATGACD
ncbi:MAG: hypothetical protein D6689_19420 [Deltaproteobacteria bacterium]|nr:MAG: hypothetical protein D6689_19420 [Deltaproteobacteria bacterium]